MFDGGYYQGELALFSLSGMEALSVGSPAFITEAARRALTDSELGRIAIRDRNEGAKFSGSMPGEYDWGIGTYQGIKTFALTPGDTFAVMLVPNGTVQKVYTNPSVSGDRRPLFSIASTNAQSSNYILPIADATGSGSTFALEDVSADRQPDNDYNDIIFTVIGATGNVPSLDSLINPTREWRNTTLGQQLITYANSLVPPDREPPVLTAALANDTGSSPTDSITSDPTLTGSVTHNSRIASFRATFDSQSFGVEVKEYIAPNGSFTLTPNVLAAIKGSPLSDGTYTLYLQATDERGNTSTQTVPFTLDTTTSLTLGLAPDSDTAPVGDGQTQLETVTLRGQAEPNSTVTLVETGAVALADATGQFEFPGIALALGENLFTAIATDRAGNSSTTTLTVTRTPNSEVIWLAEGESFASQLEHALKIPSSPSTLKIEIAGINFDTTDPDSINDAWEIALLDASGKPLTHTLGTGRDAFFNLTKGQSPQTAVGATFNGSTVTLDLSQIAPGTSATLQVRLVNNDSDTATKVGIATIAVVPSVASPPASVAPVATVPNPTSVNFATLVDVSGGVETEYKQTSFNSTTKVLYADLALKNIGQQPLRERLLVGVTHLSDPTVRVVGTSGITPDGIPYYDFTSLVGDGLLKPGETTPTGSLKFHNPDRVQFNYDLVFFSELNQPPQFSGTPDTEVVIGKPYVYTASAVDPEGDAIVYSLVAKPQGMEIDSQTGRIVWNPTTSAQIGNHTVTVKADDGNGGITAHLLRSPVPKHHRRVVPLRQNHQSQRQRSVEPQFSVRRRPRTDCVKGKRHLPRRN